MSSRASYASQTDDHHPRQWNHGRYGTRLQLGGYIADIVPDDELNPCVHHCILQRLGSPNILFLGQEVTFAAALECGHRYLQAFAFPRAKRVGAIYEFKAPLFR